MLLVKLLALGAVAGMTIGQAREGGAPEVEATPLPQSEGFGKVVQFLFYVAVLIIAAVIILGLLSVFGVFASDTANPPV